MILLQMKDTWMHFYAINDYFTVWIYAFQMFQIFFFKKNSTFNTYNEIFIYINKRKIHVSIFFYIDDG